MISVVVGEKQTEHVPQEEKAAHSGSTQCQQAKKVSGPHRSRLHGQHEQYTNQQAFENNGEGDEAEQAMRGAQRQEPQKD